MTKSGPSRTSKRLEKKLPKPPRAASPSLPKKVLADLDHNSKIFRDTLIVLDMSVQSLAAVIDDLACGREVVKTHVDGVAHVDYNHYLEQFRHVLLQSHAKEEEPVPVEASPITAATDEEVRIFGGVPGE
jgi:hypothetical protein